jgi:hypothetical protein
MSYRNAITGILAGSTWIDADHHKAVVLAAAARHVTYLEDPGTRRSSCPPLTIHERAFRARWRPVYDRAAIKSQFSMCIANMGAFTAYWIGRRDKFLARSVSCVRRFRVPEGAVTIATYSDPCRSDVFLEDLDDVLARLEHDEHAVTAAPCAA